MSRILDTTISRQTWAAYFEMEGVCVHNTFFCTMFALIVGCTLLFQCVGFVASALLNLSPVLISLLSCVGTRYV